MKKDQLIKAGFVGEITFLENVKMGSLMRTSPKKIDGNASIVHSVCALNACKFLFAYKQLFLDSLVL